MDLHDREPCFGGTGFVVTCDRGIDVCRWTGKIRCYELTGGKTRSEETAPATPRTRPPAMRRRLSREKQNRPTPRSTGATHEEAPNLKDKIQGGRMSSSTAHGVTQGHKLHAGGESVSYRACRRNSQSGQHQAATSTCKRERSGSSRSNLLRRSDTRGASPPPPPPPPPGGCMGAMDARSERIQEPARRGERRSLHVGQ